MSKQRKLEGQGGVFHRIRLRKAHLGKSSGMKDKNHSEASRQLISDNSPHLSGEKHSMFGKHQSEETKQKQREANTGEKNGMYGKGYLFTDENNPNYKGGPEKARARSEEKHRDFGFIPLNDKFPGADAHHLDKELVLYIPHELHSSVYHNMFTGKGMEKINNLACEYVYGIEIGGEKTK